MSAPPLQDADYEQLLAFRIELRRFLRHSETVSQKAGLTPALHQLLLAIRGGTSPTIGAVADALDLRHHTAVDLAQRAEALGLIERARGSEDARRVHLALTADGARSLDELTRQHLPAITELADRLAGLTARAVSENRSAP
jgi:DNA-binding MarR family transcriptional regulator